MEDIKATSSALETELYFLIARFLSAGPCTEAAKVLLREITENRLLPKRCDWLGKEHDRTYANLVESHPQIGPDHLLQICQRLGPLLDKEIPPVVKGIGSLLGAGKQSLLRTPEVLQQTKWKWKTFSVLRHQKMLTPPVNLQQPCSLIHLTSAMQQVGTVNPSLVRSSQHYSKLNLRCRSLGHLSAVYCVLFDKTGAFIITGADDHLVKIWSVLTGRLLVSLRGHSLEITDMAINHENTLLATGSCDKTIRVWDLNTGAPRQVLLAHTGSIASLQFCPLVRGENRYLLSTGADACVCFWVWNTITCDFNAKPIKFIERSRAGAQMLGSSFSPGGIFLATGNSDNVIRVYCLSTHVPEKICELEAHTDRVDSVQYANLSDRFISGGKDGYAKIWSFDRQQWKAISLNVAMQLGDTPGEANARPKLCVNMVAWSAHDHFVITSISDFSIKVWHSETGKLEHVMKGHTDEGFVLETHPVDPYILLSSGHDGNIIIWDIRNGSMLKKYFNHIDGQGYGCILDTKWSPDGLSLAATDSHGYYINVGYGSSERYKQIPDEYFFHTDYRPLIRDSSNFVLDEQTQQPPHLMPPPFLVDVDGNPHPPELQRLVPGREKCKIGELVPQIGVAPNGEREVLDIAVGAEPEGEPALPSPALEVVQASTSSQPSGLQAADSQPSTSATTPTSTGPDPGPSTSTASGLDNSADTSVNLLSVNTSSVGESSERSYRPSIDDLIERMQADQDERMVAEGILPSPPLRSPAGPLSPVHRPRRPSSAVESVRHSVNTVPAPQQPCNTRPVKCKRRYIIPPTSPNSLRQREELQVCLAEEETSRFLQERKRQPFPGSEDSSDSANVYIRTRQHRRGGRGGRRRRSGLVETGRNRLTTRALYDSDVEEEEEAATYDTPFEISEDEHKEIAEIDEQEEEIWSSDRNTTSDSSDYSDWQADNQRSGTLQPPKRTSSRKVRRRHLSTTTEEEVDLEEDDVLPEPQPTPEAPKVRRNLQRKKGKRKVTAQSKILDRRKDLKELPEAFRPPEWLTDTMPRKSPFVPQMGDEVVYFRQGHEQYLKVVEQRKAYKVNHEKNQPWHKYPNLREHEFMQIVGIKYEVKPPRLVCLKLKFLNPVDDQPDTFSIKYHDMPDVIDFIVLKQNYDTSVKRNWKVGSRFRCMIDDAWWLGQIVEHLPFQDYFPDSLFQCFYIVWDNTEQERLSPWDLEPVNQTRLPRQGGSLPVLESELHAVMYKPGPHEWPKCGKEAEQLRIAQGLSQIMELAVAEHFLAPVDATKYPAYYVIVEYPMDLNTIKSRVENHYYRRITSMLYDVRFLEANSCKFNEPSSDIVKKAKIVTELCLRFIQDTSLQDPMMIYTELTRNVAESHNSGSDTDEQPQQSATTRNRHRAISMSAQELSDPDAWKGHCIQLLDNLLASDDSTPFRQPVNMDEYPDYAQRIKEPMDLGFIQEQLLENCYESPTDLARDIRLVFTNSKTYNLNKRSRIYTMTLRLSVMFEQQFPEILEQYNKALKHNRSSRKSRYKKKSSPSRLTRSSAQQPSTSTISSRPFPRASANMIRSLVVNNVAPSVPSGSSSSYINGHQSSSPDPGTRKKRAGLEYKPEPVSANSRKIEPHQNSYKATKRKRRVLSSDDAEKTEEDVTEEFQGEADEDDIDSDSDYEQPSRTGKRPPPARKVRAARPIPPKKRKRRVCYVEGESNESFDHTSDSDYKDEPLPLRKKTTKRYINNNRKGFVADDDSDDLEQGADVLSDASDYSDSPQTRGKKKTAPRYVLKPTANTRAVNTRTSKSLQSNGHTASDRSLRRTARSSRLHQEKASSDGTEDDETDIDTEEESTEHSDSNTETEGTSNSDTDQSPVRYESRRRRAVPKASADLMAPSASSANRGRSLTHRRASRRKYSGSSAGSSPRRPPRRRNMGTVNYNESFDEPVRTRRAVNYDESDEESDDGGEHVSISSRGRVRKPTTRARAVSNIFY